MNPKTIFDSGRVPRVGQSLPRRDAYTKVTGEEKFATDYYARDFYWAGVKRAGIPSGRIKSLHLEPARQLPGVRAILTWGDIKGSNRQGVIRKDQPVLVEEIIRHAGDAVVLVVAKDHQVLIRALEKISLDCEPRPPLTDLVRAQEEGIPGIHPEIPGNVLLHAEIRNQWEDEVWRGCDAVVQAEFMLPWQEHAYLETEAGWAYVDAKNRVVITASTQTPFRDRAEVAEALGLEMEVVRVIAPYCGGAFGGKDGITVQTLLGLAALNCPEKPIKMWWDREESFIAGSKRHPVRATYRLGAQKDGRLEALEAHLAYDTGPYDHLGGAVMCLGTEHAAGPYRIPHVYLSGKAVYTNHPIGGAFRGFGVPQVTACMEQMVDILAASLNLCPLEIRRRNALGEGDKNPIGVTVKTTPGLAQCLDRLAGHPFWLSRREWKAKAPVFQYRGVGIACVMQAMGYGPVVPDVANAKIEVTREGNFKVYCGVVDMGQGNVSTNLQIAAHLLNQEIGNLEAVLPDTDQTLPSGSASASRTTYTFANALVGACQIMRERLLAQAVDRLRGAQLEDLSLVPGKIFHRPTKREIPISLIVESLSPEERVVTNKFQAPVSDETPVTNEQVRLHGIPHILFSYGAHLARVEVDTLTGNITVKDYLAIHDCGKVINPQVLEQQIQGAIAQGIGYALMEELVVKEGMIQTLGLSTYAIPTSLDLPEVETILLDLYQPTGLLGMKGGGEVAINGPLPAIANALADACGIRIFQAPLTGERVLEALIRKKEAP